MTELDYLIWRARGAWARVSGLNGRFRRDAKGATAVEFGLVVLPFTGIMLAMLETANVFWAGQVLENAVQQGGRLVLTGQAKQGDDPSKMQFNKETFRDKLCDNVVGLFNCKTLVTVDVQTLSSFAQTPNFAPKNGAGQYDTSQWGFNPGSGGDVILVRAAMAYPIWMSFYSTVPLANLGGGKRLIMASSAFRNEPFK